MSRCLSYRGTSRIRDRAPLGPYRRLGGVRGEAGEKGDPGGDARREPRPGPPSSDLIPFFITLKPRVE